MPKDRIEDAARLADADRTGLKVSNDPRLQRQVADALVDSRRQPTGRSTTEGKHHLRDVPWGKKK
jgi:hypothetical protein